MKTRTSNLLSGLILLAAIMMRAPDVRGQGTVNFDAHNNWIGTGYAELGMEFHLVIPQGSAYDVMGITYGADNTPRNGTPFLQWFRQYNPHNYVALSLPGGASFGLTSVDLADPTAPSPSSVSISFVGHLGSGSTVTNTFVTPGNGATTFANYAFDPAFASGLMSVDILAPRWAMDNLVWVPEPSGIALLLIGTGVFIRGRRRRRDC